MNPIAQANIDQCLRRAFLARFRIDPRVDEWQLDVSQTGRAREQIERLKNKTDLAIPNRREFVVVHLGHVLAVELVTARTSAYRDNRACS